MLLRQIMIPVVYVSLFTGTLDATEKKIVLIEQSKQITQSEIRKSAGAESEKNADGGYNANPSVVDSFAAMEYRYYTGGRYENEPIKFRLLTPETTEPGKKYPLVIWFHGVGESGEDNTRQLSHVQSTIEYLTGKDKIDFYLLATQCPGDNRNWGTTVSNEGKGDAPITIAEEILDAIIEEYPVDTNRLGVFGLCSGGSAAWDFVDKHPGRFSSMVACTAGPGSVKTDSFRKTAVWVFSNKDDPAPWEQIQRMVDAINASGGNALTSIEETGGHDSWGRALFKEKVVGWMVSQSLDKPSPPPGMICYHRTSKQLFSLFGLPCLLIAGMLIGRRFLRRTA